MPASTSITFMLVLFDNVGDRVYSSQSTIMTGTTGYCPQLSTNPLAVATPGEASYMLAACAGSGCGTSNMVILSISTTLAYGSAGYGPFTSSSGNLEFVWSSTGPMLPPLNTAGLIVSNINYDLGSTVFQASVPLATGSYSLLTGDNGQSTSIQTTLAFPQSIPVLGEPWGQLASSAIGVVSHSETVAFGLYDGCGVSTGAGNLVTLGPPHTFPPFITNFQAVTVLNPGIPLALAPWSALTTYWGSSTNCAGSRIVVQALGKAAVLQSTCTSTLSCAGVSSSGQPTWSTACSGFTIGQTCSDSGVTWKIQLIASARVPGSPGNSYAQGSPTTGEVYDSNTGALWMDQTSGTCTAGSQSNAVLFGGHTGLGDVVTETSGTPCSWINIGLSYLINPGFGVFYADGTPSQTVNQWSKQEAGGGGCATFCRNSSLTPYLSKLLLTGVQYDWTGCTLVNSTIMATCDGSQQQTKSTLTGVSGGSPITLSPMPSATSCASFLQSQSCTPNNSADFFIQAVWATPDGPATPLPENVLPFSWTTGDAITGSSPSNPPPNAVGYLIYVSNSPTVSGANGSGNDLMQVPDGLRFTCSTSAGNPAYVTSLPYGQLCAPGATWQVNLVQTGTVRPPTHNASGVLLSLGGPALLPPWSGGCYGVRVSNVSFVLSPSASVPGTLAWALFNQSCEESTIADSVTVSDALAGATYWFGPAAQNSTVGYIHTTGTQADSTIGALVEDVTSFHQVTNFSCGPAQGTEFLGRSCVDVQQNLVSNLGLSTGGLVENASGEALIETISASNAPLAVVNHYGRCCPGQFRSSLWGIHLDQYVPGVDLTEMANGGAVATGANIQDDACSAVNPATTTATPFATSHYIRDEDINDLASCMGTVMNSDPGSPSGSNVFNQFTQQLRVVGTAPSVSSCGTSPGILTGSTDNAFRVQVGSSAGTSCVVTFHTPRVNTPACTAVPENTNPTSYYSTVPTTTQVTIYATANLSASSKIDVLCF
jgi:hypothetical protein